MAIPLLLTIAPGCAHFQNLDRTRMNLVEQLGGEKEGKQDDGSIIKCVGNKRHSGVSIVRGMVRAYFKSMHNGENPHIEVAEEGGVACGKASRQEGTSQKPLLPSI